MITKITDFKREIQDWMEGAIKEFNNPDPRIQKRNNLKKLRMNKKNKLKNIYGL